MVLKDKHVVIPINLRDDGMFTLHRSHIGIVKTKERASGCMFWPRMYSDIEKLSTCRACMMHKIKQSPEPLTQSGVKGYFISDHLQQIFQIHCDKDTQGSVGKVNHYVLIGSVL